jgi:hypothetical protein
MDEVVLPTDGVLPAEADPPSRLQKRRRLLFELFADVRRTSILLLPPCPSPRIHTHLVSDAAVVFSFNDIERSFVHHSGRRNSGTALFELCEHFTSPAGKKQPVSSG